ncbi:NUDIX domain-containing protein [Rhizobium oryzicola]|uniref:NUDIX domain-containing protein n=1 Tax=Rhizobium oryzicola TaxID=1232668 RepID=A0ABT8T5E2_9HYPH|nr:NUDIX domain-containing protein [Rhizobium oryzicola]MDO1585620.1 NUDIX domain-containing protein [Rhizobium oryzicola]
MDTKVDLRMPGVGVGLLIVSDDLHVLLYRRKKEPEAGYWNIPGGKVDFLEHSAEAARREAEEETGLTIGTIRFLCVSEQLFPDLNQHWVSQIYGTLDYTGQATLREPDKFHDFGWFPLDNPPQPLSRFAADAYRALMALRATGTN